MLQKTSRNIVAVQAKNRSIRVALKNAKQPPQVVANDAAGPNGSSIVAECPESQAESCHSANEDENNGGEE